MRQVLLDTTFSKEPWSCDFLELIAQVIGGSSYNPEAGSHCSGVPVSERHSDSGGADTQGPVVWD